MIAFTDVQYGTDTAQAACVVASDWADEKPAISVTTRVSPIAAYEPGQFYKRELPCLLAVLDEAKRRLGARALTHVVIDGYVWLDDAHTPGLGAHLHTALGGLTPVIGIAKTAFKGSQMAGKLARPGSEKPLFVTAAGVPLESAMAWCARLHGPFRMPTLLKAVDQLARG